MVIVIDRYGGSQRASSEDPIMLPGSKKKCSFLVICSIYTLFSVSPVIEFSQCLLRTCSLTTELSHKHGKIPSMSVKILAAQETTWLVWQIGFHEGLSSWLYGWYCTFPPRMCQRLPQAPGSKAPLLDLADDRQDPS